MAPKILPYLWFDGDAEEAAALYTELVPASGVGRLKRYGKTCFEIHGQPEGKGMVVEFHLGGQAMLALNGGTRFRPTPAVSYFLTFEEAASLDRAWDALGKSGRLRMPLDTYPWSKRYGWVDDRWGMSWQLALGPPSQTGGQVVTPMLLFTRDKAGQAEAAMAHYSSIFPGSGVEGVLRHDGSGGEVAGTVMHAQFRLAGQSFMPTDSALEHDFTFTEANSFVVLCDD